MTYGSEVVYIPVIVLRYNPLTMCEACHRYRQRPMDLHRWKRWSGKEKGHGIWYSDRHHPTDILARTVRASCTHDDTSIIY